MGHLYLAGNFVISQRILMAFGVAASAVWFFPQELSLLTRSYVHIFGGKRELTIMHIQAIDILSDRHCITLFFLRLVGVLLTLLIVLGCG